jgi:nucleoside-diphosphate-sugar epimerase
MNVLVTGSSGHIGGAAAERLAAEARVTGLDRRPGACTTLLGGVEDRALVRRSLEGADAVVHTAALHVPDLGRASAEEFHRINVEATHLLLEEAAAAGVSRFVLLSTTSIYGCSARKGPPAAWADETLPPLPMDEYDRSKLEAEALCRAAAGRRMRTVILRLSRCFPETDHLVAFYRLYRGIDRRDAAEGIRCAVTVPVEGSITVNLTGPTPFEPSDAPELWSDPWSVIDRRAPGVRGEFQRRGWPLSPRIDRVYSGALARRTLGFQARFGIMELLCGGSIYV